MLNASEFKRYHRHILLDQIGLEGQTKIKNAKVAIVGLGGLGHPCGAYLAAAGVGTLGLFDDDVVNASNLHRQILFDEQDIGLPKVECAAKKLERINPHIKIESFVSKVHLEHGEQQLRPFDMIIDCTDNFLARYSINELAQKLEIPIIHGSIYQFEGQVAVFSKPTHACYRCLYSEPPPPNSLKNCSEAGVLGVLPGTIGTLQATEALKLILGIGKPLVDRLLVYDALEASTRNYQIQKDPKCKSCGPNKQAPAWKGLSESCELDLDDDNPQEVEPKTVGIYVDIREAQEIQTMPTPFDALRIPMSELSSQIGRISHGDIDQPIILVCHSGKRSLRAAKELTKLGHLNVKSLRGGLIGWYQHEPISGDS